MLDFLRRSATSVFSWLILAALAVVFVVSFGLPTDAVMTGSRPLVKAFGERIDEQAYRVQYNLVRRFLPVPKDARFQQMIGFKEEVLESAIERELLRDVAEEMGLEATERDAEDLVANGHIIVLGDTYDWLGNLNFDYELFTNAFLRPLQTSEKAYLELQRREWLARTVRDLVEAGVPVAEGELRRRYDDEANRISLRYARFAFADFARDVDPTAQEIEAWLEGHRDELAQEFDRQGTRFLKLPPQAKVSVIELPKAVPLADATDEAAEETTRPVAALAVAVRQRLAGGEDFRTVARENSAHASAPEGGALGWITIKAGTGIDPVVDQAITDLGEEGLSPVLEGEHAFYIVRVEGKREGDVPQEEALRELAADAVKLDRGRARAEEAARETLEAAREQGSVEAVIGALRTRAETDPRVEVRETGLFSESEPVPALGRSPELVSAAWTIDAENKLLDQVYTVGQAAVVAVVERRETGTDEEFLRARPSLHAEAKREKAARVLSAWAKYRCRDARDRGQVIPNDELLGRILTYDVPESEALPTKPYAVCDRVGGRGGLLRSGLFGRGDR